MTTRQRILDEAKDQLLECGYPAFTMSSVRDSLGLSSGSMFHAFASKPALVAEIYVAGMRAYQHAAVEAIDAHDEPAAAVEAWIGAHLTWVSENRNLARFLFATQPDEVIEAAAATLADANLVFRKTIQDLLDGAQSEGLVAPLPFAVGYSLVMGATQEYCRQWTRGATPDDPAALIQHHQRIALASMRATLTEE